jgi:hypothetical protein
MAELLPAVYLCLAKCLTQSGPRQPTYWETRGISAGVFLLPPPPSSQFVREKASSQFVWEKACTDSASCPPLLPTQLPQRFLERFRDFQFSYLFTVFENR